MSVITAALKELIAAGVTGDALVTAIENIENALNPVKSSAAIRQQRYRDNEIERNALRNVTLVTDNVTEFQPAPPSDGFPHPSLTSLPSLKENPPKGGQKKVPPRATRLPDDWELPQDWGEWAETHGLSENEILTEGEKFKDHWHGSGKTKVRWEPTWRNWIRRFLESKNNVVQSKNTNRRY